VSMAITRPLHKMTAPVRRAGKFDCSTIKDGYLSERSVIKEVGLMQMVFNDMMVKFMTAIENNTRLQGGERNGSDFDVESPNENTPPCLKTTVHYLSHF
jgi:hypothetical protein